MFIEERKLLGNAHLLPFQFENEHLWHPITYTSFSSTDLQLLPAVACVKCLFCLLVPAEKHGDFLELVHQHDSGEPFWLQFMACLPLTFRKICSGCTS